MNESLTLAYNLILRIDKNWGTFVTENGEEAEYQMYTSFAHIMHSHYPNEYKRMALLFIVDNNINDKKIITLDFLKNESGEIVCNKPDYIINDNILEYLLLRAI
jgi:hypothetical protein